MTWLKWEVAGIPTHRIPYFQDRFDLLSHAASAAEVGGLWLEFGVWKGSSINHLALLTRDTVYGFDSFEGLPSDWTPSLRRGAFSTGGRVPATVENVVLLKGLFEETLPGFLERRPGARVSLMHIDCDLYMSTQSVLRMLRDRITSGTVIVFDEYAGVMPDDEARAFREYLRLTGDSFSYIGYSGHGSLAVSIE